MSAPSPADVRRWSEEVARDPASLAFLPLASAYRTQGRGSAAVRLLLRGLERHPENVEAHHLLGLALRDEGEAVRAFDEWDIALRLDPEHLPSRREIGLICLERGEWAAAARHLERAAAAGGDAEVDAGLTRARQALGQGGASPKAKSPPSPSAGPGSRGSASAGSTSAGSTSAESASSKSADAARGTADAASPPDVSPSSSAVDDAVDEVVAAKATRTDAAAAPSADGSATLHDEFVALAAERGIAGAVLMDSDGLVVAGEMKVGGTDRAPEVAATLSGASTEAERVLRHLELGAWKGILLETPDATVRLAPAAGGDMVAVAAERTAPTGWVLRVASRARDAADRARPGGAG